MIDQETIADKIRASVEDDGRLTCAKAHQVARHLGLEPSEVGDAATLLDIEASRCQLGLFGHGPKGKGKGGVVESRVKVGEELEARIRKALLNGRLPCSAAWEIASEFKLKRLDLGNAAETLGVRISPCQLGFF